ncbi:MAG: hypothetical protein Q7V63_00435 [Gammaproteobacteria bacterium]|nr:hypothetical protein [Gammaproteobacteria bacterium]
MNMKKTIISCGITTILLTISNSGLAQHQQKTKTVEITGQNGTAVMSITATPTSVTRQTTATSNNEGTYTSTSTTTDENGQISHMKQASVSNPNGFHSSTESEQTKDDGTYTSEKQKDGQVNGEETSINP